MRVPTGTFRMTSSPSAPVQFEPSPWRPRCALYSGLNRKCTSVLCFSLASMITSPPRPPSPPDGPPRGTNFSRRKAMQPFPPPPAPTRIFASATNIKGDVGHLDTSRHSAVRASSVHCLASAFKAKGLATDEAFCGTCTRYDRANLRLRSFQRLDHYELAHPAAINKLDLSRNLRKQGVVFAASNVETWLNAGATLANDDASARNHLATEGLYTKPLSIRVAAILGRT